MEGSNRIEPLRKSENELKRRPLSVMTGAQSKNHRWLRNVAKKSSKKGKWQLTLGDKSFVASWTNLQLL
mgnify:CR=1 FL=1